MDEMKATEGMSRRGFLAGTGALAATAVAAAETNTAAPEARDPFLGTQGVPLKVGFPNLQAPIFEKGGVQLVVCAHTHRFRFDEPTATRPWAQVVGGGPELGVSHGQPNAGRFPTVVEGKVVNGRLRLLVHDVFNNRVVLDREIVSAEGLKSPRVAAVGG